ncbi:MAG: hypothetical protein KC425_22175, partial [Anaerolineales bacterium]|nr:hypothetical protein [Anaerolineales bacterium]
MQQNQSPPTPFAPGYDVRAWAIWLLAAAAAALLARNPLYSLILLLVALLVDNRAAQRPFPWWRLA